MSIGAKNVNRKEKPLILFSCLDWGLGHTTRSVPLMREFLDSGCDVIVACNSVQKTVLIAELPDIEYVELPGYDIQYSSSRWRTRLEIVFQIRKILTKINQENRWLTAFLAKNQVTAIVSDNRYGFYHSKLPSILITHQLSVHTSGGRIADKISQKFLFSLIARFSECWVPDFEKKPFLAGKLSHPAKFPGTQLKYLGALSRFQLLTPGAVQQCDVLLILSGPEPQRTLFEQMILKQAESFNKQMVLVRGLPDELNHIPGHKNLVIYNYLPSAKLNELICNSRFVVCRSGYTSIMDLTKLKKKIIVIATPGQPEQEYLASWLAQEQLAVSIKQNRFSLEEAINMASTYPFRQVEQDMQQYKTVIRDFIAKISS